MIEVCAVRLEDVLPLRHAVLRPGRPPASARFAGDEEPDTVHLAALAAGGALVGCATLLRRPWHGEPGWQLRGMATRADRLRQGVGTAVLRAAERTVHARGGPPLLWCNARLSAVPFYASAGWIVVSEAFDVPDIGPHHEMLRRLAGDSPR